MFRSGSVLVGARQCKLLLYFLHPIETYWQSTSTSRSLEWNALSALLGDSRSLSSNASGLIWRLRLTQAIKSPLP